MLAYMCKEARLLEQTGASVQEIIERLETIRKKVTIVFTVDSLEFAHLGGRVNSLQASISSLLQIKPIILLKDGLLDVADKVRTRSRALDHILKLVQEKVDHHLVNVAVVHARDLATADFLVERVRSLLNCQEIILTELSIAAAANLGPRTVGLVVYPVEEN